MNTTLSFARHHLVLDHSVTSSQSDSLASVLHPTKSLTRKYSTEYHKLTKIRRRWSSTDLQRQTLSPRRQSSQDSSASESSSPSNWSEYTVRKSQVKFRTRRGAKRWSGRRKFCRTPSSTIKRVLNNVYDISRDEKATFGEKIVAVLYSWFYGWITDVYYSLTEEGREKSLLKWALASTMVTGAAIFLTILLALGLYFCNFFLLHLLNAGLLFTTILVSVGIAILGFLAICNYD